MPMPQYLRELRSVVGPRQLILAGVSAIIRDEEGYVLLIRRNDTGLWALPAGIMEMDEAIAETVVREACEETGLDVGRYASPAFTPTRPCRT